MPYGIREVTKLFCEKKPLYKMTIEEQYRFVIVLHLINKEEKYLKQVINFFNSFKVKNKIDIFFSENFDHYDKRTEEYKTMISAIKGFSEKKRKKFFERYFLIENYTKKAKFREPLSKLNEFLYRRNDNSYEIFECNGKEKYLAEGLMLNRSKLNFPRIKGRAKNITFEILKKDDERGLFLDRYSDCCQGILGEGSTCVIDGMTNKNSGFLVFERKNTIFAQGWIRKITKDTLLIDSIEFKGDFNESLIFAIEEAVKELGFHFKHIYLGLSPNRREVHNAFKDKINIRYNHNQSISILSKIKEFEDIEKVFSIARQAGIYSDARNEIIKLK